MTESQKPSRRSRESIVETMAIKLQAWYVQERSFFYRDGYRSRDSDLPVFCAFAKWLIDNSITDYRAYLRLQFTKRQLRRVPPSPKQCFGPAALKSWQAHRGQSDVLLRRDLIRAEMRFGLKQFDNELMRAKQMQPLMNWTDKEVEQFVLLDPENQLSALFRFCVASKAFRLDIAASFQDAALLQYLSDRQSYDAVWKDFLPRGLQAAADALSYVDGVSCRPVRNKGASDG